MLTPLQAQKISPLVKRMKKLKFYTSIDSRIAHGDIEHSFSIVIDPSHVTNELIEILGKPNENGYIVFQRINLKFQQLLRTFKKKLEQLERWAVNNES